MGHGLMRLVLLASLFISSAFCLQCYKCLDSTKACNYGRTSYLGVLNCSSPDEVCATFQYETDDSNRVYKTTVRGCQLLTKDGICDKLMKTISTKTAKNVVKKGVFCETCNTDLCNTSESFAAKSNFRMLLFLTTVSLLNII